MIEQIINIGNDWLEKQEYIFQMTDAILYLLFLIAVLYLFIFALYSVRKPLTATLQPVGNTVLPYYIPHIWKMKSL